MILSELVKIKRDLESLSLTSYELELNTSLTGLAGKFENKNSANKDVLQSILQSQENINLEFSKIRHSIDDYKKYIDFCIDEQKEKYYKLSEQIYQDGLQDNAEYVLNRRKESLTFAEESNKDLFTSRLGMYNSWKYPAIEIRPAFGEITELLKGCDPLYLLDTQEQMFSAVKKLWTPQYQNRLRYYSIDNTSANPLNELPDGQFGFITAVDYFNFKPVHVIKIFLEQFYVKLRPGGVVMFNYNNCDLPYAVKNVENYFCCYTPGTEVKTIAKNIGFEIVKSFDRLENISWLELRKPGEITTLRGGQTLGEILNFSDSSTDKKELSPGEQWAAKNGSTLLRPK